MQFQQGALQFGERVEWAFVLVYGVAVGILKVSTVVLGPSYLIRLFAALVTTGATRFESPDPIFSLGGSSKGFTN